MKKKLIFHLSENSKGIAPICGTKNVEKNNLLPLETGIPFNIFLILRKWLGIPEEYRCKKCTKILKKREKEKYENILMETE